MLFVISPLRIFDDISFIINNCRWNSIKLPINHCVSAICNIVDQIFIVQGVGYPANAATNAAFPLTAVCMALSLLLGSGCASNLNIEIGKGALLSLSRQVIFLRPLLAVMAMTAEADGIMHTGPISDSLA